MPLPPAGFSIKDLEDLLSSCRQKSPGPVPPPPPTMTESFPEENLPFSRTTTPPSTVPYRPPQARQLPTQPHPSSQPDYKRMSSNPSARHAHYRNDRCCSPHSVKCPSCHPGEERPTAHPAEDHGISCTTLKALSHEKLRGVIEDTRLGSCTSLTTPRSYPSNRNSPAHEYTTWRTTAPVHSDPGDDLLIDRHRPIQEPSLKEPTESGLQALTETTHLTMAPTSPTSTTDTIRWCRKNYSFSFYYFR
jgi:hypothetical protein